MFYFLTIVSVGLLIATWESTSDIAVHDTYFIIGYADYFIPVAILSLVTALIYSIMDKKGKPIKQKTGLIHFILIAMGLLLSINIYKVIMMVVMTGAPDTTSIAFDIGTTIFTFGGPVLLICGLVVFLYGLTKAIRTT